MKRLLPLLLSCFLLSKSFAQNAYVQKFDYKALERFKSSLKKQQSSAINDSSILLHNLELLKGRKPGVYRLPQDNMPYIVPDTSKVVGMPNAWRGPKRIPYQSNPPRIPNLAKPWVPYPIANENSNTK